EPVVRHGRLACGKCSTGRSRLKAAFAGGGLVAGGITKLYNCTVSGNSAEFNGGLLNVGITKLYNCTVSDNFAYFGGGGVANEGGTATLTNCTVSGNSDYGGTGGLYNN